MAILTNISLVVVIGLGGRYTISGNITTGDFVAFITYLNLLTWPMMAMGWVSNLLQRGSASMRRINRILEEVSEIRDPAQSLDISGISGNVLIKGLWLRYPEQKEWALRDINMELKAGDTAAIVGRVGSGKTTLLQTLPRLLNIPAGAVFIGGNDICQMSLKILRQNIGFATQEAFIFSDTVRNNVIFGREGISEEHLEMVLHAAGILEDIKSLENGVDTMLGENGITLSGGQRQRLTIARAVLADPLILVLDDALSMVDTNTEEHILNQVLELRRNRTNLIVSHRVSTISRAGRIFVFEMGQVIEQGTHEELLKLGGIYSELYAEQLLDRELEIGVN
jgi:ATP-binding cassette subfamily B protein